MLRKYLYGIGAFVLAFAILSVSLLQTSSLIFAFTSPSPSPTPITQDKIYVNYDLPFPGEIMPGTILWPFKALRDKITFLLATSHLAKAEAALLFSDKRLAAGQKLIDSGDRSLGISVVDKAEKYLELAATQEKTARGEGVDTSALLSRLASASLKHRAVIEECMVDASSEDKSRLLVTLSYSRGIFRDSSETLVAMGKEAPKSPFNGQ